MKAFLVSAAAVALLTATPAFAQAGPVASDSADAQATVIAPIAVANSAALNFGNVIAVAGTVSVDAAGGLSGNSAPLSGTGSAAKFTVTGEAGYAYTATLPSGTVTLTKAGGGATMSAAIRIDGSTATDGLTKAGSLVGGADEVSVIGALTVGASQATGTYEGSFNLNAQYN